jgi:SmpA / OmlA family
MIPRTRRLLLLALPAAVVALIVAAWLLWPHTAITCENAAKIQVGMTRAEVEALLGEPTRGETPGRVVDFPRDFFAPPGGTNRWRSDTAVSVVSPDATCRIMRRVTRNIMRQVRVASCYRRPLSSYYYPISF